MAVYKVPQDVEAEDKLLGPLSFRQFIYFMIAGGGAFVAFLLFQISPFLILIPLPIVFLFGILALPLRKDQPMETYLLAIIRFWLKPKRRIWDPDGTIDYVEITAPKVQEDVIGKGYSGEAAEERLDYLARVMDSRGWAVKGVDKASTGLTAPVAQETAQTSDIMDDHATLARSFDQLLAKKNQEHRSAAVQTMQQAAADPPRGSGEQFAVNPYDDVFASQFAPAGNPTYNPYGDMRQKVIQPFDKHHALSTPRTTPPTPKTTPQSEQKPPEPQVTAEVSPAIISLANNNDLSISAIAHEAHRLQEGDEGEVVISLH